MLRPWAGELALLSLLSLAAVVLLVPLLVVRLPVDYVCRRHRRPLATVHARHPLAGWLLVAGKNLLGASLLLAGLVLLLIPGQGALTLLAGLLLMDFPGKFALERRLLRNRALRAAVNRLRARRGRPPLQMPGAAPPAAAGDGRTIRAVLFDFGGVVAEEGFRNGLQALAREQGLDPDAVARAGMDAVYESGFVLGQGTAAAFWRLLRRRTGLEGADAQLTERILSGFRPRAWMLERVQALRASGLFVAILSDQTHWLDAIDDRTPFKHAFDCVFNSYYLGKGKRDPTLFDDVVRQLGLAPAEVLFVDDDAGNVDNARRRGLRAIHYRDRAQLLADLERLGLSARTAPPSPPAG